MSGDAVFLALLKAKEVTGASDKIIRAFHKAVTKEIDAYSIFPKGFF